MIMSLGVNFIFLIIQILDAAEMSIECKLKFYAPS